MNPELIKRLGLLGAHLETHILGQPEPLQEIVGLLQRSLLGFRYPQRPVCSMLLAGPTGVGKTETVNLFTQALFGEDKHVRFDMSEYMTADSINILRGRSKDDPGTMEYHWLRTSGKGVMLFDEIEKANPLILDIFLQILSAGRFSTANGKLLDLSGYIVVATTNLGSMVLMASKTTDRDTIVKRALSSITAMMRPEIFGRFDLVTVFNKLPYFILKEIAGLHTRKCLEIMHQLGHRLDIDPGVIEHISREGWNEHYGARPMEHVSMRILGDLVAQFMIASDGSRVSGKILYDPKLNRCYLE